MTATTGLQVFALPDLGEGLTEAEIVEWRASGARSASRWSPSNR